MVFVSHWVSRPFLLPNVSKIVSMLMVITLFVYSRSMFMIAMLFRRSCPIVVRRYVSMRRKALNDHSAEQEPAGIDTRMVATSYSTGSNAWHVRANFLAQSG